MIYASRDSVSELQLRSQSCLMNSSKWYRENRLKINSDESKVMLTGSKAQSKSLNVDDFILKYKGTPFELVGNAKYLGMCINSDIRIFPKDLFLQVYKSYIEPLLDYGINLHCCSTQKNIELVQRVQNHVAKLITGKFDYVNCRGIDLIKSLNHYMLSLKEEIIFLQYWCLELYLWSHQCTFQIALLWIFM